MVILWLPLVVYFLFLVLSSFLFFLFPLLYLFLFRYAIPKPKDEVGEERSKRKEENKKGKTHLSKPSHAISATIIIIANRNRM